MAKLHLIVLTAVVLASSVSSHAEEAIKHRFLAMDFMKSRLHYVDQSDESKNWSMPWGGGTRDMQLIGDNRLMIVAGSGWTVYSLETKKEVDKFQAKELGGALTGRRMADGRTLIGANQKDSGKEVVAIYELDKENKITRKMVFPQFKWLRLMRLTAEGTLLLSEWDGASEISLAPGLADDQRVIRRFKLPRPRNAYMALRKPDSNTLVAGGYAAGLFEFKPDGTLLRELVAKQPEGMKNHFYSAIQILKNGHIVQGNWNGHNEKDYKPGWKLIEFDAEGKVVWTWHEPPEKIGTINGVIILDDLDPKVLNDDAGGVLGAVK